MKTPTPILRIFDEAKAREFYFDYLGFTITFEHRFADNMPLYMGISCGECVLHLTEHHGDACPGGALRIEVEDIKALHKELKGKKYRFLNPGVEKQPWGSIEMSIKDPFGNRITFFETVEA